MRGKHGASVLFTHLFQSGQLEQLDWPCWKCDQPSHPSLFPCQVEVDWTKIQAKLEMEMSKEREKAANASVRSSVSVRRWSSSCLHQRHSAQVIFSHSSPTSATWCQRIDYSVICRLYIYIFFYLFFVAVIDRNVNFLHWMKNLLQTRLQKKIYFR